MKKFLFLSLLILIAIQVDGQQLFNLENLHQTLTEESELQRKDKSITNRDAYKRDSTYRFDDFEDNLQRKWIYYDYNFANNYASYEDFDYEGNMMWSPNFKRNREFNADGSVSAYQSQRYEDGSWVNSCRASYEYNESGFETLHNREGWDTDLEEWVPFLRFERTYNSDNILLTLSYYNRDFLTGLLDLAYVNTYTVVNNVTTDWITEYYNDGALISTEKTEIFLNAENDRDSTYRYSLNGNGSDWDLISRYIYPEDFNAPVRSYQTDLYRELTDSWDPQFLTIYTDDMDIEETQFVDRFRSDEDQPEYYLDSRLQYFWSNNPLDVEIPTENEIDIILPNPFEGNPQITVNGVKENTIFAIYDINGNIVFVKNLEQSNSFNLNKPLANGTYFINLTQGDKLVEVKKIVKIR